MGGYAAKAFLSMLRSSQRMPGRSWKVELVKRILRLYFEQAATKPAAWSRAQLDKVPVSKKLLRRVQTQTTKIAGLNCLEVVPENVSRDLLIVYLHGGAYVTGSPRSYRGLLAQISLACKSRVIAPDYRLSPEHTFPAAQDDCVSVVSELLGQSMENNLILMGDSAGGGLAISTALALGDRAATRVPDALVLISPWVEPTASAGTMQSNDANDIFSKDYLDRSFSVHMQDGDLFDTRVNFRNADLLNLPPCYIQWGSGELFHDQIKAFVQRAKEQGVEVETDAFAAQFHVFQAMSPWLKEATRAIDKIAQYCVRISQTKQA